MLEIQSLSKRYGATLALNAVSFTIRPGEILGYLGPNGSGKSTTVRMLTGLMEPTSGDVFYNGQSIRRDLAGYKRLLGYVPEEANLYPYLSGLEYLHLIAGLRGMERAEADRKTTALLRLFGLWPHRFTPLVSYSKGMRQKILILAALLHDPQVLIFDEPLSGLDITAAGVFRHLLSVMAAQGRIILYCSHVLEVVEQVCTHVIILDKGVRVAYGTVGEVRSLIARKSLQESFAELVQGPDTLQIAREMAAVVGAA